MKKMVSKVSSLEILIQWVWGRTCEFVFFNSSPGDTIREILWRNKRKLSEKQAEIVLNVKKGKLILQAI